jgi:DNA-binding NarL/FixJ family response regulator
MEPCDDPAAAPAGIRVLVADDEPRARQSLRALLTTQPQIRLVAEATNGREALERVAGDHPDVVLLDVRMPELDGLEATRRIKARWPATRVIVHSMYPDYRAEALAAGADAFVVKGDPPNELLALICGPPAAAAPGETTDGHR